MKNCEIDEILHGAVDIHVHSYPELSFDCELRMPDADMLNLAKSYGIRGIVLKSHFWPTFAGVYHLKQRVEGIEIWPSLTMNVCAGGISPLMVEAAARQGCKVVWLPTWSSKNDITLGGFSKTMGRFLDRAKDFTVDQGIYLIGGDGRVIKELYDVFDVLMEYDLPLFTGHVSPVESIAVAKAAKDIGFKKLVFGHPDAHNVQATDEQIMEMASLGAFIECVALGTMPVQQRIHPRKFAELIKKVGADQIIVDTDYFFGHVAPEPEMLRMLLSALAEFGVSKAELEKTVKQNPCYLLGIDA